MSAVWCEAPPDGALIEVLVDGDVVVVGRCGGKLFALEGVCPHAGGALAEGDVEGERVFCPLHGWGFDVFTGVCDVEPSMSVAVVAVEEFDGRVRVGVAPEPAGGALQRGS